MKVGVLNSYYVRSGDGVFFWSAPYHVRVRNLRERLLSDAAVPSSSQKATANDITNEKGKQRQVDG